MVDPRQFRVRCFSSICGGFVSLTLVSSCTDPSNCIFWEDTFVDCCNIPTSVQVPIGFCGVAWMKDTQLKKELTLLAEKENIMVPTCGGAYVPARRLLKESN